MFRHPIAIAQDDIDHMGHVNNSVYLEWVQDAVIQYWQSNAPADAVAKHLWVALKHEITYRKPTFLDDQVFAEVIAVRLQGARAFFTTMIRRGEEAIAEVKSCWCCLDAATRRPARLAPDIASLFFND
jgi:acyl-CoA thioester hydrolase